MAIRLPGSRGLANFRAYGHRNIQKPPTGPDGACELALTKNLAWSSAYVSTNRSHLHILIMTNDKRGLTDVGWKPRTCNTAKREREREREQCSCLFGWSAARFCFYVSRITNIGEFTKCPSRDNKLKSLDHEAQHNTLRCLLSSNLSSITRIRSFDMDMSYTRVLHIKVAYHVPHKWRHAFYVTRPLLSARITCYVTFITHGRCYARA
jgi:hypothetical protein